MLLLIVLSSEIITTTTVVYAWTGGSPMLKNRMMIPPIIISPRTCRCIHRSIVLHAQSSSNLNYNNNNENTKVMETLSSNDDHHHTVQNSEKDLSTMTSQSIQTKSLLHEFASDTPKTTSSPAAAAAAAAQTNTINTRLLQDIELATQKEKRGGATSLTKYFQYQPSMTQEEREVRLQQARNLNGIQPISTLTAGLVAICMGYGIWLTTQSIIQLFYTHPISVDAPYLFTRIATVFRNVVIGLCTLASGFFTVTGLGILLLGIRVTQGVVSGELDPNLKDKTTTTNMDIVEIPNIWEYMTMDTKRKKRK